MIKIKHHYPLIILSLVFLCNPNMNILDILPDCIAYTLLTLVIGGLAQTVPYLAECKGALIKLALLTAIKIPAFTVMYSNLKYGSDIVPLFTLSFAVLELILICIAVKNLFLALSYIGERTDCISVRGPFSIGRRKSLSLEMIERVTIIFFVVKAVLNVLPELMLLYNEDFAYRKELMDSYPAVLVISVLAGLIIGIFWLKYPTKLAKHASSL